MNEWTVVTALSVVAGLVAAVAGPIVKLNGTISRLSAILEHVLVRLDKLEPVFWAQAAAAVLSPVLVGLGLQWEDMTSWAALGDALYRAVLNPVIVVSILVSVWTAVTDPTTAGLGDSGQALTYEDPKRG